MQETGFLDRTLTIGRETYRYQVYVPAGYSPRRRWPVILFLHGAGEGGSDGLLPTEVGIGSAIRRHAAWFQAIVVFPQARADRAWRGPMARLALAALDAAVAEFHGDPRRLSLTGLSMGGTGTWRLAVENPGRFAAIAPVCPGWDLRPRRSRGRPRSGARPKRASPVDTRLEAARSLRDTPVWVFHGEDDDVIPAAASRRMVAALEQVGAPVRYTELADTGHNAWDPAYNDGRLVRWLLARRRSGGDRVTG